MACKLPIFSRVKSLRVKVLTFVVDRFIMYQYINRLLRYIMKCSLSCQFFICIEHVRNLFVTIMIFLLLLFLH